MIQDWKYKFNRCHSFIDFVLCQGNYFLIRLLDYYFSDESIWYSIINEVLVGGKLATPPSKAI